MSRTVSSNRAGGESFEGLLERLTRRASSADSQASSRANLDAEFASGSSASAASLPGARRRPLAPVAEAKSGVSKADSMPLSYEKALRLHARRNLVTDTDLRNPGKEDANPDALKAGRDRSAPPGQSDKTSSASRTVAAPAQRPSPVADLSREIGLSRRDTGKRADKRKPQTAGMAANIAPTERGTVRGSISGSQRKPTLDSKRTSVAPQPQAKARARGKLQDNSGSMVRKNSGAAAKARTQLAHSPHATQAKTTGPQPQTGRQLARRDTMRSEELRLEVPHTSPQLEHRHAVVSIRLNDSEIERLRQRAAESGISVSAYMRSCVLEAEHLRTQVKQALAEMRASIQPMALPTEPMGPKGPALLPPHLAVLAGSGSSGGGAWSRLLWKSATFLLGPWFFLRHRG